jgi:hypothetical protein
LTASGCCTNPVYRSFQYVQVGEAVCEDGSDENEASYSGCYPNLMAFARVQEFHAVPIALPFKSKERPRYITRFPTKIKCGKHLNCFQNCKAHRASLGDPHLQ